MARLILDVMGGDYAPHSNLQGAIEALPEIEAHGAELLLLGDEAVLRRLLTERRYQALSNALRQTEAAPEHTGYGVRIQHSAQTIEMDDSIRAIRRKPNATINVGSQLAAESYQHGKPAALISAGHSGAMMASALLFMGRLKGVERPAIAVKLPSLSPDGCVLIDAGANVDCKPEHLRDFAIMGALFAQIERQKPTLPKVGLMSNGEERVKGTDLTRAALLLIEELDCLKPGPGAIGIFEGYAEGKEIFKGNFDVIVTDGFVGNVVLKAAEGLGSAIFTLLKGEGKQGWLVPIGFFLSMNAFRKLKRKVDYAETGAAPVLGVSGYSFVCHGRSNSRAIKNALFRAMSALDARLIERMEEALATAIPKNRSAVPSDAKSDEHSSGTAGLEPGGLAEGQKG